MYDRFMVKGWDIVAYTFQADTWCPGCVREYATAQINFLGKFYVDTEDMSTEGVIGHWADAVGIDRDDEHSYDSGDFPKVVFASSVEDTEHCGQCGQEI